MTYKPDFLFGVTNGDIIYDIETYPNIFTLTARHAISGVSWVFEVSQRRDETDLICQWMDTLSAYDCTMAGYNNIGFDYPVIHFLYKNRFARLGVEALYNKAMSIINCDFNARFAHMVWDNDMIVPQLDLFKMMHFDNPAKATSLKVLEFNMRMKSVEDLPFEPGTVLTNEEMDTLLEYNMHDVVATEQFFELCKPAIELRKSLSAQFDKNMMNMSDVKIGETLLIMEIEKRGTSCYTIDAGGRKTKKQTIRDSLALADVIFPYVRFELPEFNKMHQWLNAQVITETKGVFKDLKADIDGITYKLGTGGLHASMSGKIVKSTETHQLIDVDVASFYPNLAIKNKLYPEHLGVEFCGAYDGVYHTRRTFPKGTPENEAYKLALNGAYGGSNNKYSPFFDMKYTMSITINGQLLLCMLVEQVMKVPGLTMVQCNTDGITYLCPREYIEHTRDVCRWWESITGLDLEEALYSRMVVKDVNNYIAEYEGGKLKRIGAYAYKSALESPGTRELPHHKDWSARVVAKAAESYLVHGKPIRAFIESHDDKYDFLLRTKVPRSCKLEWGGEVVQNTVRYYISVDGDFLEKVSPPKGKAGQYKRANKLTDAYFNTVMLEIGEGVWDERVHTKNKSVYDTGRTSIHTTNTVMMYNTMSEAELTDIDYSWYIKEAEKLTSCMSLYNDIQLSTS